MLGVCSHLDGSRQLSRGASRSSRSRGARTALSRVRGQGPAAAAAAAVGTCRSVSCREAQRSCSCSRAASAPPCVLWQRSVERLTLSRSRLSGDALSGVAAPAASTACAASKASNTSVVSAASAKAAGLSRGEAFSWSRPSCSSCR